jgi:hypothetical protein
VVAGCRALVSVVFRRASASCSRCAPRVCSCCGLVVLWDCVRARGSTAKTPERTRTVLTAHRRHAEQTRAAHSTHRQARRGDTDAEGGGWAVSSLVSSGLWLVWVPQPPPSVAAADNTAALAHEQKHREREREREKESEDQQRTSTAQGQRNMSARHRALAPQWRLSFVAQQESFCGLDIAATDPPGRKERITSASRLFAAPSTVCSAGLPRLAAIAVCCFDRESAAARTTEEMASSALLSSYGQCV